MSYPPLVVLGISRFKGVYGLYTSVIAVNADAVALLGQKAVEVNHEDLTGITEAEILERADDAMTTADAALRVLDARARGAELELVELELAAWQVGLAGGQVPAMPEPTEDLHVRMAALFGAGDDAAGLALLDANVSTDDGYRLLSDACHFVGDRLADELLEIGERHSDATTSGRMLARTRYPERLLALVDRPTTRSIAIGTVAELVVRGRDRGARCEPAERRWVELSRPEPTYEKRYRESVLRIAVRESMDHALADLDRWTASHGHAGQSNGAIAVLARLVRDDAQRACALVAACPDPDDRLEWLEPLLWWFSVPREAEPIVDELLSAPLDDRISLLRMLIRARDFTRLDRALALATEEPAADLALGCAAAVAQLRRAGHDDAAARARARLLPLLSDAAGDVAPLDLFDARSGVNPPLVPWLPDPGVP